MKTSEMTKTPETPLSQDLLYAARYYLGGRKRLIALAGSVVVAGAALNWRWLGCSAVESSATMDLSPLMTRLPPPAAGKSRQTFPPRSPSPPDPRRESSISVVVTGGPSTFF